MNEITDGQFLAGLKLQNTLLGHEDLISGMSWSADGKMLASSSRDRTIRLWNTVTGELNETLKSGGRSGAIKSVSWSPDGRTIIAGTTSRSLRIWNIRTKRTDSRQGHSAQINSVSFSPNGKMRASGSSDKTIRIYVAKDGKLRSTLKGHTDEVLSIAWSPDGQTLVSASSDKTVQLWAAKTGKLLRIFHGHSSEVLCVACAPDGRTIASGSSDCTIRIWDSKERRQRRNILEGHAGGIICVSFSFDGRLLASKSTDGTVRLWRCDTWEMVREIDEPTPHNWDASLAFHPSKPVLATFGQNDTSIRLWNLDIDTILNAPPEIESVRYTNAKVVLLGNSGVGKSGLGLVLAGKNFEKTDSTHARYVWTFDSQEAKLENGYTEVREVLLWDLAGQPGYRLIHQLHLNEVSVALVVFDASNETDPFAGVHYWNRALNEAKRLQGDSSLPLKKFLVSARVDRGGIDASVQRIQKLVRDLDFDGYFQTSAREGWEIAELTEAIRKSIDWEMMPSVSSTQLFQDIKEFLVMEKQVGRLLSRVEDLYRAFVRTNSALLDSKELRPQFETCIGRVESQGLIQRLSFGGFVLLKPELLDVYASAIIMAARDEPDGLGCIAEKKAQEGTFRMSEDERISDKDQEKLLLIATVEDLLHREIALREESEDGAYLVFPSQFTRELPNMSDPEGKAVTFEFEGAIQNIYSKLAVRLSHSGLFIRQGMWKNVAVFTTYVGGSCGMLLRQIEEGRAELTLFFDTIASEETRFQFEEYIYKSLCRQVSPETIKRRRIFVCSECATPVTDRQVMMRKERGFDWIRCNVCDANVSLLDREERLAAPSSASTYEDEFATSAQIEENVATTKIAEMDRTADLQRARDTAASSIQGKIATQDFDVFICHNSRDKSFVKEVGEQLKEQGILPWLDDWELQPGLPWQQTLEQRMMRIKSAAVFVGSEGIGPWQNQELEAFLREFVRRGCPVIPVLLSDAPKKPSLPVFLRGRTWVDFRVRDPDPLEHLLWGITGDRIRRRSMNTEDDSLQELPIKESLELRVKDEQIAIYRQQSEKFLEITKLLAAKPMSETPKYDLKGAQFSGGFAETVQGNQIGGTQYNYSSPEGQTLAEAAAEIQKLLEQLEETNPTATEAEKQRFVNLAIPHTRRERFLNALQAGGLALLEEFPGGSVVRSIIEGWMESG